MAPTVKREDIRIGAEVSKRDATLSRDAGNVSSTSESLTYVDRERHDRLIETLFAIMKS
jgi:propanediol dehydratase small subunit